MPLVECNIVYYIDYDIPIFDIERLILDIERGKSLRYRIRYLSTISNYCVRYRRDKTLISASLFVTFDIDGFGPSISNWVLFDIEYLRYRYTISNNKNVDIEYAFDIHVFDIECIIRYRLSINRYWGAKDPDEPEQPDSDCQSR
jgi:hypothetical protein